MNPNIVELAALQSRHNASAIRAQGIVDAFLGMQSRACLSIPGRTL
jgi:hypothetical protein